MAVTDSCPAFSAFEKQLKTLCLREFPCGLGTWRRSQRKTESLPRKKTLPKRSVNPASFSSDKVDSQFAITLKDYGANHEKMETLQEYVGSRFSPWHLDYSWSQEARELREIAVKSPWLIDDSFVLNYFKTLRIVDKNVTEVDEDLLKFKNLEELTLSANHIKNIGSKNLPESLKVLELCANEISDISALCINPPLLTHLGLGHNNIAFIGDYITGDYWPCLLSLDLSHNDLSDLLDVVRKLGTLPKLRNLILQGNPLSLIPGYRGYTIDSLRKLSILDDIRISADEKHHFKGLARRREYVLDEAKVTIEVSQMTGLPVPEELKNPEEQPEFPIIERKYYVEFMFLEDSGAKAEVLHVPDDVTELPLLPGTDGRHLGASPDLSDLGVGSQGDRSNFSQQEKSVCFTSKPELETVQELTAMPFSVLGGESLADDFMEEELAHIQPLQRQMRLSPLRSPGQVWAEEMEMNWSSTQVRDDLHNLRDFFTQGMKFSVVEQMVQCFPLEEEDVDRASVAGSVKKGKDDKNAKGDKKGKPEPKKEDKKKKKKEPEVELRRTEPQLTTLATFHVHLDDFLEGDFEVVSVFSQGGVETAASTVCTESPELGRKEGKKDKDLKDKKATKLPSANKKDKGKDAGKAGGKVKDADKKDGSKKGKATAPTPTVEEGEDVPPPPLEVHVSVRLHHWKTAMDSLKEEEDQKDKEQD
ncbi:leucine-rich repeat-containing protein 43-like [Haliotis cracherodii]|uniref:leucine-rich repeat-containing protein 43-like n=1 Tax=Haliotis cracherodii TaxID=6455 RepID=UPI0039E9FB36